MVCESFLVVNNKLLLRDPMKELTCLYLISQAYTGQSQPNSDLSIDTGQDLRGNINNTTNLNPLSSSKRKRTTDNTQLERNNTERLSHRKSQADSQLTRINTGRHTTNINNHESSDEESISDDEPTIQFKQLDNGTSSDVEIMSMYWHRSNDGQPKLYFKCRYFNGRPI